MGEEHTNLTATRRPFWRKSSPGTIVREYESSIEESIPANGFSKIVQSIYNRQGELCLVHPESRLSHSRLRDPTSSANGRGSLQHGSLLLYISLIPVHGYVFHTGTSSAYSKSTP